MTFINALDKQHMEGEPCDHPGCLLHVSHPCEGCGRQAGVVSHQIDLQDIQTVERKQTSVEGESDE